MANSELRIYIGGQRINYGFRDELDDVALPFIEQAEQEGLSIVDKDGMAYGGRGCPLSDGKAFFLRRSMPEDCGDLDFNIVSFARDILVAEEAACTIMPLYSVRMATPTYLTELPAHIQLFLIDIHELAFFDWRVLLGNQHPLPFIFVIIPEEFVGNLDNAYFPRIIGYGVSKCLTQKELVKEVSSCALWWRNHFGYPEENVSSSSGPE